MNTCKNQLKLLLTAILCLFLSSCDVVFVNSLIDPKDSIVDKNLLGKWKVLKDSLYENDLIEIKLSGQKLIITTASKELKDKLMDEFYTISCNEKSFIIAAYTGSVEKKKQQGYVVIRYKVENDSLKLWLTDPTMFKAAIREGKLSGKAGEAFDSTIIAESANEAKKFLCSSDDKMFGYLGEVKRVR